MLKIYGSMLCPDCVQCRQDLDAAGIGYVYLDFADNLVYLKEFLNIRDSSTVFEQTRLEGKIGIPCMIADDGRISLDWMEYVSQGDA